MPPKMGLRVSSCFHNAFSAVDCQEISGRFWPIAAFHSMITGQQSTNQL